MVNIWVIFPMFIEKLDFSVIFATYIVRECGES